jgi:hypothetical protein
MAIRSGIGIGEAQVFDTSGLANQYARQVAADQANLRKQAIENQKRNDEWLKDLAGTVSSTKLLGNGLHPKDVSKLTDYRAETLALYNKASQATNPQEKALLKAEVDKSIQQELEYVNGAKFFRQSGGELFNEILKNPWDYDDNVRNTVKDVLSHSYIDAVQQGYGALDKTSFKSNPDGTELNKSLDNVHKYVDKAAYLNTPAIRTTTVGQNKDYTVIGSTAKESDVFDYNKSLIEANNKLRYDVKSDWKIRNPDAQADPTDNDLAIHLTNLYKEKYGPQAFKAQGSPQKIAKAGGTNEDVYAGWLKGAFTKDKESSLKNLSTVAGSKVKITPTGDGITITYKPVTNVGTPQMPYYMESINPKTAVAKNAGELAGILRDAGVTGAGSKLISKVGGSSKPIKPTIPNRQVDSGYKINQILGGYKYIGGPADDKSSWVKVK